MNLLAPDLLCELHVMVRQSGEFDIFQDKISISPEIAARLCQTFVQLAGDIAKRHGLTLRLGVPSGPPP